MQSLDLATLRAAVSGDAAAIRRITILEPQGEKIFPSTYEGGEYATEQRVAKNPEGKVETVETVLLDSVQSQANRMELAILRAYDSGLIRMPLLEVDFSKAGADEEAKAVGRLTALEAPHRMVDAIFRDSVLDGKPFRETGIGAQLNSAKSSNATAVFEVCPTALIFGFWDSTGPSGGLGAKVQRALVSEIVGYGAVAGKRTSSRIDPLQIENNVEIFEKQGGGWTSDVTLSVRKNDQPVKLKPSEINHGNITPSFKSKDGKLNHGGVSITSAKQHTVLSLAALRRLRFPLNGRISPEVDRAAQTVLAALGLVGICFLDQDGYDLRSRCLLDGVPGSFEFIGRGTTRSFELDSKAAADLLREAVKEAVELGLPWPEEPVTLEPSRDLIKLVGDSRRRSMSASAGA